jgi:hypothetical protein
MMAYELVEGVVYWQGQWLRNMTAHRSLPPDPDHRTD